MQVEDDEPAVLLSKLSVQFAERRVERVVFSERAIGDVIRQRILPNLQAPRIFRSSVHGLVARAIEVGFKSRTQPDDPRRSNFRPLAREWIFLSQAPGFVERHVLDKLLAQLMPVMDGGRHERPMPDL